MSRDMQLRLVIGADGRAVAPVTAEVRREVAGVGEAGRAAASDLSLLTIANDEAAASARRAMEATRGQAQAERELRASIDRAIGVRPVLNDNQYRQRQADIAAFGAELDRLRARFVPAAAAEQSLLAVQNDINRAFRLGAINAKEQAAALESNRLAHDRVAAAAAAQAEEYRRLAAAGREAWAADQEQNRISSLLGIGGTGAGSARASADVFEAAGMFKEISDGAEGAARSTALATHEMTNLTYQMNDVVLMLASGQSPFMLMMQQGSQITQIMGQRGLGEILPALGGALTRLISPTTMFLAGITAAGYAGYAAFRLIRPEAVNAEDALQRQADLLEELTERYERVGDAAKRAVIEGSDLFRLRASISEQELGLLARSEARSFLGTVTAVSRYDQRTGEILHTLPSEYREFEKAIEALRESTARGIPDVAEFRRLVSERWGLEPNNDELTRQAKVLLDNTAAMVEYARRLEEVRRAQEAFARNVDAAGRWRAGDWARDDMDELRRFRAQEALGIRRAEEAFAADMLGLTARSPAERAAAARAQAAAQHDDNESAPRRRHRIDLDERRALAEAEYALAEASRERALALSETLSAARLDLDLIGKSVVEVDRLRMEHQLLSELRREAAQNGVEASQQEIDAIRAVAAETAQLRAIAGARELIRTKAEELDMLRVETALVGASAAMRSQVLARLEAEREIRERGINAMGREAQQIRAVNAALAEQQLELERLQDGWSAVQQAGESTIDTVFDRLLDGDWTGALKSIGDEMLKLTTQIAVTNPLKNAAFGTNYGTMGDLGGWAGIFGRLFGGGDSTAATALGSMFGGQAVASMSVTAGTVILAGETGGGLLGNVTRLLTGANDNASSGSVQDTIWNFFRSKGLASHQIAGIMGHVGGESAFNPFAVGDAGSSFGLFQHHASRGAGLLDFLGGQGNLGNVQGQLEYVWKELLTTERRALDALLSSRNVTEATAAFGGFERPAGYSAAMPEAMHNWTGRLREAERAMSQFGSTAVDAVGGLQTFGHGLGDMGRNLMNAFPAAPAGGGGGGLLSFFGNLLGFGGGNPSLSPAAWAVVSSGRMTGLFDKGGPTGGSDPSRIAGFVHEQEYVFDAESTRRIGVGNLDAIRRGVLGGYREGGYAVTSGASALGGSLGRGAPSIKFEVVDRVGAKIEQAGEVRQAPNGDLTIDLILNKLEGRMDESIRKGRLGSAVQQTFGLSRRLGR